MTDSWWEQTAVPDSPLPNSLHHHGQQCDYALQEEVKEEDGGSTAQKPIKDQEYLACDCHRCCHPKACRERKTDLRQLFPPAELKKQILPHKMSSLTLREIMSGDTGGGA